MISAKVIADSITSTGIRLTTIEYNAPRFILAEFNTHRVFSRNAGSSRAIPTTRIIERVVETPVLPVWSRNKPGMQGTFDVNEAEEAEWTKIWLEARDDAVKHAKRLAECKAHKQSVNRILEPYMFYKGVVSSTQWDNWFALRDHEAAQPEIAILARAFREAMEASTPTLLHEGEWHMPYVFGDERNLLVSDQLKISVARCARVSYRTHDDDKVSVFSKDIELYAGLLEEKHFSPFEHQAQPDPFFEEECLSGNFHGWVQYRRLLEI